MNRVIQHQPDELPEADQMLAMAFADGELRGAQLAEFSERVAKEPDLARVVGEFRKLELLARQVAPPEPRDFVWREHSTGMFHKNMLAASFLALILAGCVVVVHFCAEAFQVRPPVPLATAGVLGFAGLGLLLLESWRWRRAERDHDPYLHVQR